MNDIISYLVFLHYNVDKVDDVDNGDNVNNVDNDDNVNRADNVGNAENVDNVVTTLSCDHDHDHGCSSVVCLPVPSREGLRPS